MNLTHYAKGLLVIWMVTFAACGPENTQSASSSVSHFPYPLAKNPALDPLAQAHYRSPGRVIVQADRPSTTAATDGTDVIPAPPRPAAPPASARQPQEPATSPPQAQRPVSPSPAGQVGSDHAGHGSRPPEVTALPRPDSTGTSSRPTVQPADKTPPPAPVAQPTPVEVTATPPRPQDRPQPSTGSSGAATALGWPADPSKPHPLSADRSGSQTVYIVTADDSLSSIALKFYGDTSMRHLLVQANPILKSGRLIIGQRLVIPRPPDRPKPLVQVEPGVPQGPPVPAPQPPVAGQVPPIGRVEQPAVLDRPPSPPPADGTEQLPSMAREPVAVGEATDPGKNVPVHVLQQTDTPVRVAPPDPNSRQAEHAIIMGPDAGDVFIYQHVIRRSGDTASGYEYMRLLVSGDGTISKMVIGITGKPISIKRVDTEKAAAFLAALQKAGLFELKSRFTQLKGQTKKVPVGPPIPNQLQIEPGYQISAVIDGKLVSVAWPGVRYATVPPEEIHSVLLEVRMFAAQITED